MSNITDLIKRSCQGPQGAGGVSELKAVTGADTGHTAGVSCPVSSCWHTEYEQELCYIAVGPLPSFAVTGSWLPKGRCWH